ncbi:MAG: FAD-dependent oxidoreductase [Cyanobacteria bacterium J06641_5]
MWDYDIAILGATTSAGLRAAWCAVRQGARVALVGTPAALTSTAAVWETVACKWGDREVQPPDWEALALQARVAQQAIARLRNNPTLAIAGVDWLSESDDIRFGTAGLRGGLHVGQRCVRAQRYLLAFPTQLRQPEIAGLARAGYCDSESWLPQAAAGGQQWTVLGSDPAAIAWAQRLARWGKSVTLVVSAAQLLPGWVDREMAVALQRLLEADGLTVLLEATVREVRLCPDDRKEIVAATKTWLADEIFVADGTQPDSGTLNLDVVGVTARAGEFRLDRQLRAANRHIFACRTWLGSAIAQQDAEIATHNALFGRWPWRRRSSPRLHEVPRLLRMQPGLAVLGFTEAQAQKRWPGQVSACTRYLAQQPRYCLDEATSGACKIVARQDGCLLGVQLLAQGADDLLAVASLMRQQQMSVLDLSRLVVPPLSRVQLLVETAQQWLQMYRQQSSRSSHWLRRQRRWRL